MFTVISSGVLEVCCQSSFKDMQCLPVEIFLQQGLFALKSESDISCSLKSIIRNPWNSLLFVSWFNMNPGRLKKTARITEWILFGTVSLAKNLYRQTSIFFYVSWLPFKLACKDLPASQGLQSNCIYWKSTEKTMAFAKLSFAKQDAERRYPGWPFALHSHRLANLATGRQQCFAVRWRIRPGNVIWVQLAHFLSLVPLAACVLLHLFPVRLYPSEQFCYLKEHLSSLADFMHS